MSSLAGALEDSRSLQTLTCINCPATYKRHLALANDDAASLARVLEKNESLLELNLEDYDISDDGARSLAEALEKTYSK